MEGIAWCAVGAALGWIAGRMGPARTGISGIEDILVGIFGAFIGAELFVTLLWGPTTGLSFKGFTMAATGGVIALLLLSFMRRAVGPLKASRKRRR